MTVDELRKYLDGVPDDLPVTAIDGEWGEQGLKNAYVETLTYSYYDFGEKRRIEIGERVLYLK